MNISRYLTSWHSVIHREKVIYQAMNLLNHDVTRKAMIGEGWIPNDMLRTVQLRFQNLTVCQP